jgi:glycosyltransferase involved in cell wall biosynthesis
LRNELGLEENVFFSKTFFPVEKIPELVATMDVGVVPNRSNSATDKFMLPVKLMEYVYLQIPVIAPRLSIIKYYFDETMIKYFEPENVDDLGKCITDLYKNPNERISLVKNANVFFEKYSWKKQEKEYLRLLQ